MQCTDDVIRLHNFQIIVHDKYPNWSERVLISAVLYIQLVQERVSLISVCLEAVIICLNAVN